ncbi:MAG: hypothetical protein H6732_12500 [Alphaproteobacteria bacterium]|nr:hypothetical protein [Alphaproteobacteria bacterium]
MRALTPLLVLAAACGTADKGTDTVDTDGDTDVGTDTFDTDAEACVSSATVSTSCALDAGTALFGTLVDGAGAPLGRGGFLVQYCRDVCLTPTCFDGNSWAFADVEPGDGSFHIKPTCADDRFADVYAPLVVDAGTQRGVDVVIPKLGAAVALPDAATEIEVVAGVHLTLGKDSLTPPPLEPKATEVAGVDATAVAAPIEGLGAGTVRAVFYLSPFDYTSSAGVAVRLDNSWSLASGAAELWVGNYNAFLDEPDTDPWQKVGTLTLDGDGKLVPGATLPRLSTLVVFEPSP